MRVVVLALFGCLTSACSDGTVAPDGPPTDTQTDVPLPDASPPTPDLCVPQCASRKCGVDGCGGNCGSCALGRVCDDATGTCGQEATTTVAMRDQTTLWTKVFLPDEIPNDGTPTIVLRTPYRLSDPELPGYYDAMGRFFSARGYGFVLQDCRASFGGKDAFYSFDAEVEDGNDTIDWIVAQPWSGPRVGTIGSSYDGYTALAAASHPAVKAVVADGPTMGASHYFRGGIPLAATLYVIQGWHEGSTTSSGYDTLVNTATNALDLPGLDLALAETQSQLWADILVHPWPADAFWDAFHLRPETLDKVCTPTLITQAHEEAWSDPLQIAQALWANESCAHRDAVHFFLGYQRHGDALSALPYGGGLAINQIVLDHLEHYLGGRDVDLSSHAKVMLQPVSDSHPRQFATWPPASTEASFFLDSSGSNPLEGVLSGTEPSASNTSAIVVDPATQNPCDSPGSQPAMLFVSDPLAEAAFVAGAPRVELRVSASAPDVDLFVTLLHHAPKDSAAAPTFVSYGYGRARFRSSEKAPMPLVPNQPISWTMELTPVVEPIPAGHVWTLVVEGSQCGFIENPHTGEPLDKQTRREPATIKLLHGGVEPSVLRIPLLTL